MKLFHMVVCLMLLSGSAMAQQTIPVPLPGPTQNTLQNTQGKAYTRYKVLAVPRNSVVIIDNQNTCNAPQNLVGKSYHVLDTMHFSQPIRILGPQALVTMEHLADRINFLLNEEGIIREVRCG